MRRNEKQKYDHVFAARPRVRACVSRGETGWLQFHGRASSAGKTTDVRTRSHANSRIYPRVTPIVHGRNIETQLSGREGIKGRKIVCIATWGMHRAYYLNIVFPCMGKRLKER